MSLFSLHHLLLLLATCGSTPPMASCTPTTTTVQVRSGSALARLALLVRRVLLVHKGQSVPLARLVLRESKALRESKVQ